MPNKCSCFKENSRHKKARALYGARALASGSVAIRGERGSYNLPDRLESDLGSVAIRGEREAPPNLHTQADPSL